VLLGAASALAFAPYFALPLAIAGYAGFALFVRHSDGSKAAIFLGWSANGAVLNHDTHGDGGGRKVTYVQGGGVPGEVGELTAAFTGNHGWFWRNRINAPVTLTLQVGGEYSRFVRP